MIVRDEAAVIERCLHSVRGLIDGWVICDTGSVDGTPDLVSSALAGIPGTLEQTAWHDFGSNRSELMSLARGRADYLLLLDADMTLRVERPLSRLTSDAYLLRHDEPIDYYIPRLVRGDRRWRYEGSTHEYLTSDEPYSQERLDGLVVEHHGDGGNRGEKLVRDRNLLEADRERDPSNPRTAFYLAQTYRDLGEEERAVELYIERADLGGWAEEAAYGLYQAGCLLAGRDRDAALPVLIRAWQLAPGRAEALHELARICRFQGWPDAARTFAERGLEVPYPEEGLFVHRWIYDWGLRYEFALAARATGEEEEATHAAEDVLDAGWLPDDVEDFLRESFGRPRARAATMLGELLAGAEFAEIRLDVAPAWPQFNPSVCASEDGYRMVVRTANYRLENGRYVFLEGDGVIRTLNYVVTLDRGLAVTDLAPLGDRDDGPPRYPSRVEGYEDCRLIEVGDRWFVTATVRDRNPEERCEIALLELDGNDVAGARILAGPSPERHEKNWMPFILGSELHFVYSCSPTEVLRCDPDSGRLERVTRRSAPARAVALRGGSQGVAVDGGFLFVVHESIDEGGLRSYRHRLVLLDRDLGVSAMSRRFQFVSGEVEFCAGLARRDGMLVMSFGVGDHTAMLAVVDEPSALSMLDT